MSSITLSATASEKGIRRFSRLTLLALPLLVFLALFFIWPIIELLKQGFYSHGALSADNYLHLWNVPIYRIVLQNTFVIAAVVTCCCVVMSYPLAYLMASVRPALSKLLFFAVLLPFWSSALVRTSAWIALLQQNGPLNTLLVTTRVIDQPIAFLYNFTGVLIGMTHVLMPFVVLPLYASFRAMDNSLVQAAQSLGADAIGIFTRVILPLTRPGVVAGAIIVFMNAIGYYITPSLMGGPAQRMIAELISHNISDELNWGIAAALAGVLLVTTLLALWLFNRLFGLDKLMGGQSGKGNQPGGARRTSGGRFSAMAGVLCALFLILPILVVIPISFGTGNFPTFPPPQYGLRWYNNFFADAKWMAALWQSVKVGVVVTLLSLILGATAALGVYKMRSNRKGLLEILFIIPMSVPAIITAVALYYLCGPLGLINNSLALIFGHTVLATPFTYITMRAALQRFDPSLELAALSLGASWPQMFRRVMLPALLPGMIGGAVFAFITSFDDVVMALFLTTLRNRTLPKLMYEGLSFDFDPTVISASCVLIGATALILLAWSLFGRQGEKHETTTR
ncbi:putative spermidine/putrescine transport system permease protein [Erwinia toletana]|uniref:Spermidine/putrescine transport system permease protein n=1 Tax=Winslowiella toletana TaxID=92490 RepID=A0ABS4PFD9_9GAMM|nr:ABC transporter permease subunit [Winslowiella toletana]MBP2171350.1 putative spermidine/putrescine transport system permease protein [Winslowiella toletana]